MELFAPPIISIASAFAAISSASLCLLSVTVHIVSKNFTFVYWLAIISLLFSHSDDVSVVCPAIIIVLFSKNDASSDDRNCKSSPEDEKTKDLERA